MLAIIVITCGAGSSYGAAVEVTRELPSFYIPGQQVNVTLNVTVNPAEAPYSMIIKDFIPIEWEYVSSSRQIFSSDNTTGELRWLIFAGTGIVSEIITYTILSPAIDSGEKTFSGTYVYADKQDTVITSNTGGQTALPEYTVLPTATPTQSLTPTQTPLFTQSPTPVSTGSVQVFDCISSGSPLVNETDFDDLNDRELSIQWTYQGSLPITNWHLYVKKGEGGYFYVDQTNSGSARDFTWRDPDINEEYQFRVWGIYKNQNGKNRYLVLSQLEPIGYNLTGGKSIKLKKIANPDDIPPQTAIVTDDLYHCTDLSYGFDTDTLLESALVIKCNPGDGDFNNIHIYVSTNGSDYTYMGQTGAHDIFYFRFDGNETYNLRPEWRSGPQNGVTYWFEVKALKNEGGGHFNENRSCYVSS